MKDAVTEGVVVQRLFAAVLQCGSVNGKRCNKAKKEERESIRLKLIKKGVKHPFQLTCRKRQEENVPEN